MISYDDADKSQWVSIEVDLDDDVINKIKPYAESDNRTIEDYLSKIIYDWWKNQLESGEKFSNNIIINLTEIDKCLE